MSAFICPASFLKSAKMLTFVGFDVFLLLSGELVTNVNRVLDRHDDRIV